MWFLLKPVYNTFEPCSTPHEEEISLSSFRAFVTTYFEEEFVLPLSEYCCSFSVSANLTR